MCFKTTSDPIRSNDKQRELAPTALMSTSTKSNNVVMQLLAQKNIPLQSPNQDQTALMHTVDLKQHFSKAQLKAITKK